MTMVDVEALVSYYLRAQSEVAAICGQRVYTAIPSNPTFPLVRLHRIGGVPPMSRPLHMDRAHLQIDVWGGPKATALDLVDVVRTELSKLVDEAAVQPLGVVCGVKFGPLAFMPDDTVPTEGGKARPRYTQDVTVTVRPAPLPTT